MRRLELQSAVVDILLVLNPVFIAVAGTLQILITNKTEECFTDNMTWDNMTAEEIERDEFEFQVALMLEEEREFNRAMMRETGDYHRIGVAI